METPQLIPTIHTERLILRRLTAEDAADVYIMRSDPEVMRYIPRPIATCVDDAVALIQLLNDRADTNEGYNWAMEWKETGKVIGIIGYVHLKPDHFRAEIGYSLTRSMHRRGIMREALLRMIQYGFEAMNLHSIEAIIDEENVPSGALLEAVGFRKEARFVEDFCYNNEFRNSIHYGLLRKEYLK